MLKNYLVVAIRNLFRNKVHSFITITGLSLGMAGAALLLLNIQYELTVDQFHQKKDRIYKLYCQGVVDGNTVHYDFMAPPLGPVMQKAYPEIKQMSRTSPVGKLFSYADKRLQANGLNADANFLTMFSFPLLDGNAQTALGNPRSIVLTEKLAHKLFGSTNPLNKVVRADNAEDYIVSGVLKDLPENTKFRFEYLLPWSDNSDNWKHIYSQVYLELRPGANVAALNNKIAGFLNQNSGNDMKAKLFLHSLKDLNLYSHFENGKPAGGKISELKMLGILATIILLIGCINFMNLSTARSEKRAREVGVRKVMGARKAALVRQFIIESIVLAGIAGVIAFVLVELLWPVFSELAKVRMSSIPWQSPYFWLAGIGFILITGFLAGSYPAFYLSSFKPVKVLKGLLSNTHALVTPRKILVVTQFVIAVVLINYTIVFQKQINHSQKRPIGFVKENLLYHSITDDLRRNIRMVKNELMSSGLAVAVSESSMPVTHGGTGLSGLTWEGTNPNMKSVSFELINTTGGYVKTNRLSLAAGREIDIEQFPTDTASCMINEAAVKSMGIKDPIGKIIKDEDYNWTIVGVVNDFLMNGADDNMTPVLIRGDKHTNLLNIRLAGNEPSAASVSKVQAIIKKYNPAFVTDLHFADEDYAGKFKQAKNAAKLMSSFTVVAIFIACLGLFGLAIYMTENRTREIGIRKVLGATVAGVTGLLAKDFIKLVAIAVLIATPLAWWGMSNYLQQFSYRTTISWWILPVAGLAVLLIAFLTVSVQSIKAAMANPADSLRSE